ncbi:hypothetical protein SCATT_p12280 (plasmid) [Streptantibioticus cattleyicolor NRRL 8057 = DSM 46488]|uniref:Uncharacterized protein n=1 Tax=Streptantibioticus cattleyicolor (strain ATCC 35852 / DSM 46488 / JCM 4925 / NBRC 14057 / NRRL 8057) TaxID=1003195 RepID=F8JM55_STREN|nr:hypothetical protein SCATT_p12280 [Streptantibioticus cattleyicolor NRRL 8057 = DSM 46488]CCB71539.1 protein of unknown function [Streptantibioticus cattleyicolor NRRL 8057 = DSM 46488]
MVRHVTGTRPGVRTHTGVDRSPRARIRAGDPEASRGLFPEPARLVRQRREAPCRASRRGEPGPTRP